MFLVEVVCQNPNCAPGGLRTKWDALLAQGEYTSKCPVCGQVAGVDLTGPIPDITGRCGKCQKPWDDHPRKECKP